MEPLLPGGNEVVAIHPGLYSGVAGITYSILETDRITGQKRLQSVLPIVSPLLHKGVEVDSVNDVIVGSSGVGLVLLELSEIEGGENYLSNAKIIGDTLLARGIPEGPGRYWRRSQERDLNLPNFSHGAAGTGYFLARLYEETRHKAYLDGAEQAASYLSSISDTTNDQFLIPYGMPNDGYSTTYDIGWAHGPPGSARLFYLLWKLTEKPEYIAITHANAHSLFATGLPSATKDSSKWTGPFPIDQRFGTSGALSFLFRLYAEFEKPEYLSLAYQITDDILFKSNDSLNGRYWSLPYYTFQGSTHEEASYTGYFYGAAGLGFALLQAYYAETNQEAVVHFPDNPF